MDADDAPLTVRREVVRGVAVRSRLTDAVPDESVFFLVALVVGALIGYLLGAG